MRYVINENWNPVAKLISEKLIQKHLVDIGLNIITKYNDGEYIARND